jgi:Fur family transcriptional regulator, ferric uptake regulator
MEGRIPVTTGPNGETEPTITGAAPVTRGSRMTRQKRAVGALLSETGEFSSAQDLHARLKNAGEKVGLATIYSQLRALADAGEIDSVRGDTGETLYRRCDLVSHHHHLVCRRCGQAVELDAPEVESWARRIGGRYGFRHLDHVLEITGICDRCSDGGN